MSLSLPVASSLSLSHILYGQEVGGGCRLIGGHFEEMCAVVKIRVPFGSLSQRVHIYNHSGIGTHNSFYSMVFWGLIP